MNRIVLISISLLIFIVGIGCASAADVSLDDQPLCSAYELSLNDNSYEFDDISNELLDNEEDKIPNSSGLSIEIGYPYKPTLYGDQPVNTNKF
ncbi:hypothetical protein [Methanobrevibacter sp.]|uniref:hypothetical protein n=1 Tax=Methanobrevibacter sp. TaxID=66852 RepID=UPI00388E3010